jgi:[ribosomal protein S5]-alanine N-acetyltransferase
MTHKGTVTLETERLILRRFTIEDLEPIFRNCWCDPDVWEWTSYDPMNSMDDVLILNNIFTDYWFSKHEKPNYYNWAIQLRSSSEVIGRLWGMHLDEQLSQIELAYELGQNWWNQGLMTEAVKTVIDFFYNEVGFNRICANHASENPASGRVMQKCGMTYEGIMRQACKCNNGLFDKVNYAILADDYFSHRCLHY